MKKSKKVIAVLLAVVMLFAAVPSFASAEGKPQNSERSPMMKALTRESVSNGVNLASWGNIVFNDDVPESDRDWIIDVINAQESPKAGELTFRMIGAGNGTGDSALWFYGMVYNGYSTPIRFKDIYLWLAKEDETIVVESWFTDAEAQVIPAGSSYVEVYTVSEEYIEVPINVEEESLYYKYAFPSPFTDIFMWAQYDIEWAYLEGIMNGTTATTFSPNSTLDRAMLATILHRLQGEPAPTQPSQFTDLKAGAYYEKAVNWAAENEIVSGYENMTFKPTDKITRQQFATMLHRYAQKYGSGTDGGVSLASYPDSDKVSGYALSAMEWAVGNGIITGKSGRLEPAGQATRAEAATMLSRYAALG